MSMQQREARAAYIPPISCKCGGRAMLTRTIFESTKLGTAEVRTFQCFACRNFTEVLVEP